MTDIVGQFREDDLPPSGVDVLRAVRVGRRRRRTQTGVVAASVVAVLTLGAATAPRWLDALPGPEGPIAPGRVTCAPTPTTVDSDTLAGFDVLRRWINPRAITGAEVIDYETARLWQRLRLSTEPGGTMLDVVLFAQHVTPVAPMAPTAPAGPVDLAAGTPTDVMPGGYWLPGGPDADPAEGARLAWQWAPDAWVVLTADGTAQVAELRATVTQVASALSFGPDAPVYSPFMIQIPPCTRVVTTSLLHGTRTDDKPWTRFALGFGAADVVDSSNPWLTRADTAPSISVTADSGATPADKPGSATLEIDAQPASYIAGHLVVYTLAGFALEINAPGDYNAAVAIYRTIYMHPFAKDSEGLWYQATVS